MRDLIHPITTLRLIYYIGIEWYYDFKIYWLISNVNAQWRVCNFNLTPLLTPSHITNSLLAFSAHLTELIYAPSIPCDSVECVSVTGLLLPGSRRSVGSFLEICLASMQQPTRSFALACDLSLSYHPTPGIRFLYLDGRLTVPSSPSKTPHLRRLSDLSRKIPQHV